MFESLKSFRNEPEEECEECLTKDFLVDAIVDGKAKRICNRCVIANNAIVLKKPSHINIEKMEKTTVSDVMRRLTGIMPKRIERPQPVKLEDLRKRYEEKKAKITSSTIEPLESFKTERKKFEVLDEDEFKEYVEKNFKDFQSQSQATTRSLTQLSSQISQPSQEEVSDIPLDFSSEATKRITIRDILERMKLISKKETKEIEEKIDTELTEENKEKKEQHEEKI
ncbi:MAG: hypothetical protein QXK80_00620 [Candidatus Pacearchaeota archaeon]